MVKGKIPNIINLATNASLNTKTSDVKGEISNMTKPASTTAITAFENEIPNISDLVKKTDYNTKIIEIENKITDQDFDKCTTNQDFDKLT